MKRIAQAASTLALLVLVAGACSTGDETATSPTSSTNPGRETSPVADPEIVVDNLQVPWGLAFLPTGDAVVTEREGRLNVISATDPARRTTLEVQGVVQRGEGGLLGVAVSPAYPTDRWVYVYLTTASDNRVVRFRIAPDNRSLVDSEVVVEGIDRAGFHNGGRIAFGPDGMLYVATGDAGLQRSAQDASDLNGKILRMTPEGAPAPGNPARDSIVYSSGHRNVQGLAWDRSGRLYATEFGRTPTTRSTSSRAGATTAGPSSRATATPRAGASPTPS